MNCVNSDKNGLKKHEINFKGACKDIKLNLRRFTKIHKILCLVLDTIDIVFHNRLLNYNT